MQLVLKTKYASEGYQHVPVSPGDFGIEGFTRYSGIAFQCYCPEAHYERSELFKKQRDKITTDLKKLKDNQASLVAMLGDTRIKEWYLITPETPHNKLISHAVTKQNEVRDWKLPHIHEDFTVFIKDAEYYIQEINQVRRVDGIPISIGRETQKIPELTDEMTEYEQNLERKTKLRTADKGEAATEGLLRLTRKAFLDHDPFFFQLYNAHPQTYWQVAKTLNGLEEMVDELSYELTGDPDHLVNTVKKKLNERLLNDKQLCIDENMADDIVRRTMARWLAVCQMDFR
ncbi:MULTISPECIES: hypothetical protein [Pseudomonas]|uniref:Uncharacterized protein n=1 Tax=Pseudomonas taiwanensis TaxID=470150 RepID=A0A7L9GAW4_9PSED|nr:MULTISPECIES: hypothetical protein [Pseudomonas]QOJ89469.1 hypothetical protein ICN73_16490 [Pseudomonas taiwanensis]WQQ35172.1 hypothetical protein SO572_16195 [Pseudomonas putida]